MYKYAPLRLIHWDFNEDEYRLLSNLPLFVPDTTMKVYYGELTDNGVEFIVRITHRVNHSSRQLWSYITEETFWITYENDEKSAKVIERMLNDSKIHSQDAFNKIKEENKITASPWRHASFSSLVDEALAHLKKKSL